MSGIEALLGAIFDAPVSDVKDRRLCRTVLGNGKVVSTVRLEGWLRKVGGDGSGREFETLVFPSEDDMDDIDAAGYESKDEAWLGHVAMIEKWATT